MNDDKMSTLNDKIDAQWEAEDRPMYFQFGVFEGIHSMEEVEALRLGDLCDYTERLARRCKSVQATYEDGNYEGQGEPLHDELAGLNSHLGLVATLLAQRCRAES